MLQVLNQDETPLLYSLVFGEGVVNDATSVVLFRAVQTYNFENFTPLEGFQIGGSFLYLFFSSTMLGIAVSISRPRGRSSSTDGNFLRQLPLFSQKLVTGLASVHRLFKWNGSQWLIVGIVS
jgi:hypothetical protein